jgi:putative phosphoribosyl transferase
MFRDRREAGRLIAAELTAYRGEKTVVLGILRGGVIVADEVALRLGANLDILLAQKLRTPGHSELAMGAVSEKGQVFLNQSVVNEIRIDPRYIQEEKERQMMEIKRRIGLYRRARPKIDLTGRTVVVIDDGVATGATTLAAIQAVTLEKPGKLVAAFPVGPEDTMEMLAEHADETVCLRTPPFFAAVGQFYVQFQQIEDEDVINVLERW